MVESKLVGRDADVYVEDDILKIDFQAENNSNEIRLMAGKFAYALAILIDGVPLVSLGRYRDHSDSASAEKGAEPDS